MLVLFPTNIQPRAEGLSVAPIASGQWTKLNAPSTIVTGRGVSFIDVA